LPRQRILYPENGTPYMLQKAASGWVLQRFWSVNRFEIRFGAQLIRFF
jgi:hypothetical protein